MYQDLGGEMINIQGLECHLPPVGYVFNHFTKELEYRGTYSRSEDPDEQYWEVPRKPHNIKARLIKERKQRRKAPTFFETDLQEYREREWDRTTNGFWFKFRGKPTYITGEHYFYLSHWTIEGEHPEYRETDTEWHYFWEYCWQDPYCYGMLEVTQRRQGKCLEINELCRMYDGSIKRAGDIVVGDVLMGADGKSRNVLDTYSGIDWLYRIESFSSYYTCTGSHILSLIKQGEDINISVDDFLKLDISEQGKYFHTIVKENKTINENISITKKNPDIYAGFEVDGDHLFLLADGTIVHNSVRAGKTIWFRTSRAKEKKSGIQSKTDKDGERLFAKQVVNPFKKLEPIFIPTMDRAKGTTPKKVISFNKSSNSSVELSEDEETLKELISEIDYRASTEAAYDGDKLYVYISDECGKMENGSIYKRHEIVKPCMNVGRKIIGKMLYTTTVEDIGDSDKYEEGNFKRLWDESNQMDKNEYTGQTKSGLYRYFLSADRAFEYDKYGTPLVEQNLLFLQSKRNELNPSPSAKASFIRKYPLEIDEAFITPGDECIYDVLTINKQRLLLEATPTDDLVYRGNLSWKDGKRGEGVIFTKTPKGRLSFNKKFDIYSELSQANTTRDIYGKFTPSKKKILTLGIDPFDHKTLSNSSNYSGSKAAAYLYHNYHPSHELSETFICEYLMRPDDLEQFHEDMVLLAFATGCDVVIENQKQLLIKHFMDTGFENFLFYHNNTPGINANDKNHKVLASNTEIYIGANIEKVPFLSLLDDWSKFNLRKTTKFDAAMAAGWALVGAYGERLITTYGHEPEKPKFYEASDFY